MDARFDCFGADGRGVLCLLSSRGVQVRVGLVQEVHVGVVGHCAQDGGLERGSW